MGLKFKRFKAKLKWKTKETTTEVVCLRYQINSEFQDPLTTSQTIKRKLSTIPPNGNFLKPDEIIKLPITPKGILKKSNYGDNQSDDFRKSTLICTTKNHDYDETPKTEMMSNMKNINSNKRKFQDLNDPKVVNWRETVEYHSDNDIEQETSNYKVYHVNHQTINKNHCSAEIYTEGDPIVDNYSNKSHYSNQAANIFLPEWNRNILLGREKFLMTSNKVPLK